MAYKFFECTLAIASVASGWIDGEMFAVAEGAEIPEGEEAHGHVSVKDNVVMKFRSRIGIEA